MAFSSEIQGLFESILSSDEDVAAFNEGYRTGIDSSRQARLEGPIVPRFYGGVTVIHSPEVADVGSYMEVESPAFILGAATAAASLLHDGMQIVTPLEGHLGLKPEDEVGTLQQR